jgi:hypothetical protein
MRGFARVVTIASALALVGLSPLFAAGARAVTVGQYRHPISAKDLEFNKAYLMGAADALIAYNMSAVPKLFCPPGLLPTVSFEQANDMIMRYARKASGAAGLPLARALLFGLKDTYPCRR